MADGFAGWDDAYANGTGPDLDQAKAAAGVALDARYNSVLLFDDPYFLWPSAVAPEVIIVRDASLADVGPLSAMKNASSYEQFRNVVFPDATAASTAAQEIRLALGLSPDTTASCAGYENGHQILLPEKAEREAALAEQKTT